jgi:acyl-CoA thioesterase FadM
LVASLARVNKLLRTLWLMVRSPRRPALSITDTAVLNLRVRLTDIDVLRHMNNGVYLSVADLGRFDLLIRSGVWRIFQERGWYPVVANATISYRKSLDLGARYQLQTRMIGIDDRAVFMEQRFVVDGDIHARLFLRGRFLKRSGGTVNADEISAATGIDPAALPVPAWLERWAAEVALPTTREPAPSDWI